MTEPVAVAPYPADHAPLLRWAETHRAEIDWPSLSDAERRRCAFWRAQVALGRLTEDAPPVRWSTASMAVEIRAFLRADAALKERALADLRRRKTASGLL